MKRGVKETLRLNVAIEQGRCCICTMEPVDERLDMEIEFKGKPYSVTICRHCLSEHAPSTLEAIRTP